jgi:hypothetical protein
MMRRVFAIAAVLLLSGLLPLAANAGFCAARPCCRIHAHASAASFGANGCCNPTNCDATAHSVDGTTAKSTTAPPPLFVAAVFAKTVVLLRTPSEMAARVDTGPPPLTRQRLATLSILLI